ncbi:EcsC family protein [Actinomadura parmotrematis]|uniref:EcsC family protein n=1 Tax=Actinomadura parmotrematis TaxID=2864039 RepID=A0ABS7G0F6_9ACTN|nr:EcsC family protein [Actinomadura parmotrematis]MBW8486194.1 EcsC family protein [Actinomadura parmotrematis]
MSNDGVKSPVMSPYEERRWAALQRHWEKKAERRRLLPPRARAALDDVGGQVKGAAKKAGKAVSNATPSLVKDGIEKAGDAALAPTVRAAVQLLELVTDWTAELMDPEKVLAHHRAAGHDVADLQDLKELDLEDLDGFTRTMPLRWRTNGALQGGAMGALAMIPYAGGIAAIGLDMLVMHVLTTAIVTRVCHSYGIDVADEEMEHLVDRMVRRAYSGQAPKAGTVRQAGTAFNAAKGRVRWTAKLRDDHKIMAAVEKLMKQLTNESFVSVGKVAKAMPAVAVVTGAGTNAYVLGDVARQARLYAQTLHLAEKYGLPLPENLRSRDDEE